MRITRKEIKMIGLLLNHSLKQFEYTYWNFVIKRNKHHSYHYFKFVDYLRNQIDKIEKTRGHKNKHYISFSNLHSKLLRHLYFDLKLYRENYPINFELDLSQIDFSCFEKENYTN